MPRPDRRLIDVVGDRDVSVVLVGGHESADGADLARFARLIDGAVATGPGRPMHNIVSSALADGERVVVVPMTFGRNPTMVADVAKTLKWLGAKHPGRVALAAPFGQPDHFTAHVRTAANRAKVADPDTALLIVAARSNPFDEAELHRLAYLVQTHGALTEVAAGIGDDRVSIDRAVARLKALGAQRVIAVPAGFADSLPDSDAGWGGALMSDSAVVRVIHTRVRDARDALAHGHDGVDDGLAADHGHGYAHSHAFEASAGTGAGHQHPHPHSHGHSHGHTHTHADGTSHTHTHDGAHAHFPDDEPVAHAHDHH